MEEYIYIYVYIYQLEEYVIILTVTCFDNVCCLLSQMGQYIICLYILKKLVTQSGEKYCAIFSLN